MFLSAKLAVKQAYFLGTTFSGKIVRGKKSGKHWEWNIQQNSYIKGGEMEMEVDIEWINQIENDNEEGRVAENLSFPASWPSISRMAWSTNGLSIYAQWIRASMHNAMLLLETYELCTYIYTSTIAHFSPPPLRQSWSEADRVQIRVPHVHQVVPEIGGKPRGIPRDQRGIVRESEEGEPLQLRQVVAIIRVPAPPLVIQAREEDVLGQIFLQLVGILHGTAESQRVGKLLPFDSRVSNLGQTNLVAKSQ
jgi:hypothetical protein